MSGFGFFQSSVRGMQVHSEAMQVIGTNIANATTGGFRRSDVHFKTLLSNSAASPGTQQGTASGASSTGGARSISYMRIAQPGSVSPTTNALDAAITGRGFFVLNSAVDGGGTQAYGRDGGFDIGAGAATTIAGLGGEAVTIREGYLVDKNGFYLQGWAPDAAGNFPNGGGGLTSLRVDPAASSSAGVATGAARTVLNLPANAEAGAVQTYGASIIDSNAASRQLSMQFVRAQTDGAWHFDVIGEAGDQVAITPAADLDLVTGPGQAAVFDLTANTMAVRSGTVPAAGFFANVQPGDAIDVAGTSDNDGAYTVASKSPDGSALTFSALTPLLADETNLAPTQVSGAGGLGQPLTFDAFGAYTGATPYSVAITHADGATSDFSLDFTGSTQFGSNMLVSSFEQDGRTPGSLVDIQLARNGDVLGRFDNGDQRALYRIALADFANADRLRAVSGNLFLETTESGAAAFAGPGSQGVGLLAPFAIEGSNVNLENEISDMIITQTAYNSSATAFRTMDEMSETARDLKR